MAADGTNPAAGGDPATAEGEAVRTEDAGATVRTVGRRFDDASWDRLVASRPEGSFFHTRVWAGIVLASFPFLRDRSLWLETGAGPAVLPLFAWSRGGGLLVTLHSSFPFLYGGTVPSLPPGLVARVALGAGSRLCSLRLTGNPLAPGSAPDSAAPPGFRRRRDRTHLMELPATEKEYWEKGLTTAKRNDVRRLGKKGVVVEESTEEPAVGAVYGFYTASFTRWGGRPAMVYPELFYRNLLRLGGGAVRLTIARHQGRIIGGTFTVRWNGTVHYLAGYFDHESRALRPNVLIQVESILRAIRDGYRRYDFLPSGGHEAVETFKESFGGRKAEFDVLERVGPVHRLLGRR